MKTKRRQLVRELVGGETYDYYPLGKHIVSCPEVCRGRPTFKYTRIEVAGVLEMLAAGYTVEELVKNYRERVTAAALEEAAILAGKALVEQVARQAESA